MVQKKMFEIYWSLLRNVIVIIVNKIIIVFKQLKLWTQSTLVYLMGENKCFFQEVLSFKKAKYLKTTLY